MPALRKNSGWILYPLSSFRNGSNAFDWFVREGEKCGYSIQVLCCERFVLVSELGNNRMLYQGIPVSEWPAFVLMRGYEEELSAHLERNGVRVINSTLSMHRSRNKFLTHQILVQQGIPTPRTLFNVGREYDYACLSGIFGNSRFVLKAAEGSKGEQVRLISSQSQLQDALDALDKPCLAQEYIVESHGRDLRVWVIGDRVAGCVLRRSETRFVSNFSQGGKASAFPVNERIHNLAVGSARALGLEFAGADLLFCNGDYTVCEVNGNAGFRSLCSIENMGSEDRNIPALLFDYIRRTGYMSEANH